MENLSGRQLILGAAVFAIEIALFIAAGITAYRLIGGGAVGWLVTAAVVVALAAVWGTWMSPKAGHRLGAGARIALGNVLVLAAAAGLAATGSVTAGVALAFVGVPLTVVGQATLDV